MHLSCIFTCFSFSPTLLGKAFNFRSSVSSCFVLVRLLLLQTLLQQTHYIWLEVSLAFRSTPGTLRNTKGGLERDSWSLDYKSSLITDCCLSLHCSFCSGILQEFICNVSFDISFAWEKGLCFSQRRWGISLGAISSLLPHLKYCILLSCEPGRPYMQIYAAFYKSLQWVSSVRGCRWTSVLCIALPHLINTLWGLGGNTSKYVAVFLNWQFIFIGSELHLCMLSTYLGLFASHVVTKASVACVCNPAAHLKADCQTRADSCSVCCWPQLVQLNVLCCSSWCDLCNACRFAWGLSSDMCWGWFPLSLVSCGWAMNDGGPIKVLVLLFSKVP